MNTPLSKPVLIALIVIAVIGIALVAYFLLRPGNFLLEQSSQVPPSVQDTTRGKPIATEPTGNVDDLVEAVISESLTEQGMALEEDSDSPSIYSDIQAIDDFGQSYRENEF